MTDAYIYGVPHLFVRESRHEAVGRAATLGREHPTRTPMDMTERVVAIGGGDE